MLRKWTLAAAILALPAYAIAQVQSGVQSGVQTGMTGLLAPGVPSTARAGDPQ